MNKGLLILCLVMLIAPVAYSDYIEDISEGRPHIRGSEDHV